MVGGSIITRRRFRRLSAFVVAMVVLVLLTIPVIVVSFARGGLPLIGLLVSAILLAPITWFVVFGRR
jgi:accessory gene regulator protein AgrB